MNLNRRFWLLLTLGATLVTSRSLSQTQANSPVFYPENIAANCPTQMAQLEAGTYRLTQDAESATISLSPQWQSETLSFQERSNLHSLRFLECHIRAAEQGNVAALETAQTVILDWAEQNPLPQQASSEDPDESSEIEVNPASLPPAWKSEAAAWRSVLLSYVYWVYQSSEQPTSLLDAPPDQTQETSDNVQDQTSNQSIEQQLKNLAATHAAFLSKSQIYQPNDHKGIANSMALIALGQAFSEQPEAEGWIELGLERAEQQMRDNVSAEGIHLEQSGILHQQALQNFMAIYRAFPTDNLSLSATYRQKLDRMLGASALMMGVNRRVEGLPDSDPNQDLLLTALKTFNNLDLSSTSSGQGLMVKMQRRQVPRGLHLYRRGGYSFFVPGSGQQLEAVFKTRLHDPDLRQPKVENSTGNTSETHSIQENHQQNALMVTARIGNQPLLIHPSQHLESELEPYFFTPAASNTVQVGDFSQEPLLRTLPDQNQFSQWGWLSSVFGRGRQQSSDLLPEDLLPENGEVVTFGSNPQLDFVTARHQTYPDVQHTRTVARIGADYLLVWDQLQGKTEHPYRQTFHFPPNLRVKLMSSEGLLRENQSILARFVQLEPDVSGRVCRGKLEPIQCGWYRDASMTEKVPTPAVLYETQAQSTQFIWVLSARPQSFKAQVDQVQEGTKSYQLLTLSRGNEKLRLALKDVTVQLESFTQK